MRGGTSSRTTSVFIPGVNEELAATSIWGTHQLHFFPTQKVDGVFAMWYGKGPGVDRCGDIFKHANYAGTSRHGGVLAVAGDDHAAKSSSIAHQSEHQFSAAAILVLAPAAVIDRLWTESAKGARAPEMKRILAHEGAEPVGDSPEEFAAIIEREIASWRKVVERARIKAD